MKCILCRKDTGRSLCVRCWDYSLDKLRAFPKKYDELADELLPSQGRGERVGGSKTPPIPVKLETLHLRSGGISKPLMAHEAQIRIERQHTRIVFRGQEINRITITCKYLTAQAEWIFRHYSNIDGLAQDIESINKRINAVLGFRSELMTIGTCPAQSESGEVCGAKLQVNPALLNTFDDIKCRACGTEWSSEKWRLLGRMLRADT